MRSRKLLAAAMLLLAFAVFPLACANIELFTSEHVHYHPDPDESGRLNAAQMRVYELETALAIERREGVRP